MAFTSVVFKNPNTGAMKEAPIGFSWTVFFFGFFPALFRGDFKWAAIMFVVACFTFSLSNLVFMFIYNKLYVKDLINSGYKAQSIAKGELGYASAKLGFDIPRLEGVAA
ncbi:Protein of unknown function DUF2628 [Pseudomonas sp. GM41(2012)]|jgi:hypothetical protein|uniref:hypothetical protein n=1 Tax=Pseudomonas sp. (strain GM41(2012)) TaxID=1144708 RepID=UPI00026FF817|nr:hypothetical protein [Pseudomonas sp. GM41(2012)]EUB76977.1 Protein of unknown function DUF2628 [Pseudomonas sp. GM41(2012)]